MASAIFFFPIQVYMTKLTYRAYIVQLEGNSNLVKLSTRLLFYFYFFPHLFE